MYSYNPSFNIERLNKQKEEIDNLIKSYQNLNQQPPVNNFINTQANTTQKDMIEWRILNENEEVDNLYVANKTLFINDNLMVLKGVDGSLQKWKVEKIYPIDKKDEKISVLEEKIKELEARLNESNKPIEPIRERIKSNVNVDVDVKPKPEAISKSVSKQNK